MEPLTRTQHETLEYITKFYMTNGFMPSQKEIGKEFKIALGGSTSQRLRQLETKGYIIRTGGPRGYKLK